MKAQDTDSRLKITYARKEGAIGYDVEEVSRALTALNTDFKQWIKKQDSKNRTDKISPQLRLTITDIEKGSILIEFVGAVATSVVSTKVVKWAKDLGKRLLGISDGDGLKGANSLYIANCKNLVGGQTMGIVNINITGDNNTIIFPDQQIHNMHKNLEEASQSRKCIKEKVHMNIVRADNRPNKDSMAWVEEIESDPKPLSVPRRFIDAGLFSGHSNPLTRTLVVDLEITTKNDEIIKYKLLEIHPIPRSPRRRIKGVDG